MDKEIRTKIETILSIGRKVSLANVRLEAAEVYGESAVKAFNRGNYPFARQFAVEAWHYASLAVGMR